MPDEALAHFRACVRARPRGAGASGPSASTAYREAHPELAAEFERIMRGAPARGLGRGCPHASRPTDGMIATRKASEQVIQWAAEQVPELVGGSADLAPSTLTLIDGGDSVGPGEYAGRNLHFGIREHAMGAIVNGLTLHGFRAYGATFLIFSDYMKASIRLAALMRIPLDLRVHPRLDRPGRGRPHPPADRAAGRACARCRTSTWCARPGANETALAWRFALEQTETPTAMALSRQGLPTWNPAGVPDDAIDRGAYVLRESYKDPEPDLVLIATGLGGAPVQRGAPTCWRPTGMATRVVSVPCMDRFAAQDSAYRDSVLPPACRARLAVEAARAAGLASLGGRRRGRAGHGRLRRLGPQKAVYEHFGFTPENIAARAQS